MKRAAIALTLATLFFGRQLAAWSVPGNRFLYFWQRTDALPLLAAILLVALVIYAIELAIRRFGSPGLRWTSRLVFVLVIIQLFIALLLGTTPEHPVRGAATIAVTGAVLVLAGYWYAPTRAVRVGVTVCLIFAPLAPILFLQMSLWRSWRVCGGDRFDTGNRAASRPVFVLLFDEWSLRRSTSDGRFHPELPRLNELAAKSFVFEAAHSPGINSYKSIPRLLFQREGGLIPRNGTASWVDSGHDRPIDELQTLFRTARLQDYRTALVGWYLPYASLVGDDLDYCRAYLQEVKRSLPLRVWDHTWANLQYLPDPVSPLLWRSLQSRAFSQTWIGVNRSIEHDAVALAERWPSNTFALIHYPVPHGPFIFAEDGSYRGPYHGRRAEGSVADYHRHLRYLDMVLGRFLDTLEQAGKLDSAVVIVTSDHSWQMDPEPARTLGEVQRVPLFIKWPGQQRGATIGGRFCLLSLGSVIEAAIGDRVSSAEARSVLMDLAGRARPATCGTPRTGARAADPGR